MKIEVRFCILILFVLSALLATSCGGDDDDDDDDSGAPVDDATDDSDDDVDDTDDTDDTDDDTDDDSDDTSVDDTTDDATDDTSDDTTDDTGDDTIDLGHPPVLKTPTMFLISAADPDLEYFDEWGSNGLVGGTFNPEWERVQWYAGWRDQDGDLGGGKLWAKLDGGTEVSFDLPATMASSGTWDKMKVGLELTDDFAEAGSHSVEVWIEDALGNLSGSKTFSYTSGVTTHGIGTQFTDFTLRGFQRSIVDATGTFDNYTLSDYAGKVIVIDSFAGWCGPCNSEAPQLDEIKEAYSADDLMIFSMMMEDYYGSTVDDIDLENWTIYNYGVSSGGQRTTPLTGVILNDDGAAVAYPFWLANYVPDNFVLDADHIVRFKMSGFSKSQIMDVIDALLAE